jgi:hypothetical protein
MRQRRSRLWRNRAHPRGGHTEQYELISVTAYKMGQMRVVEGRTIAHDVPSNLDLNTNYKETAAFLQKLRCSFSEPRRKNRKLGRTRKGINSYYDFSKIKKITPEVALIIASEYEVLSERTRRKWRPSAFNIQDWDKNVLTVLHGIGFFELSGVDDKTSPIVHGEDYTILRLNSGITMDGSKIYGVLLKLVNGDKDLYTKIIPDEMWAALVEAITNTLNHAYSDMKWLSKLQKKWWVTGTHDRANRRISLVVYDRGSTIPYTLPRWSLFDRFGIWYKRLFRQDYDVAKTTNDGNAIRVAMRVGNSRTKEKNRGHGLAQILEPVTLSNNGIVQIYSRHGYYSCEKGLKLPQNRPIENALTSEIPLAGTLIVWTLNY